MQTSSPKALAKYQVGFAVLGVLTFGLLIFVLLQAQAAKTDTATYKVATKIAADLQAYTSSKNTIPSSLQEIGATKVPDTIKYTKLSSSKYKFCVSYKAESGFSSGSVTSTVLGAAYGGGATASASQANADSSYLYVDSSHKKGENCQTIKPYIYDSSLYGSQDSTSAGSASTNIYTVCGTKYPSLSQSTEYNNCVLDNSSTVTN